MKAKQRKHAVLSLVLSAAMILGNLTPLTWGNVQTAKASGGEVHIYDSTPGDVESGKYTMTANGTSVLVIKYSANGNNFASGHYNPSDGFTNTVPGYDQYNSDCLEWDTEDSFQVSVSNTLGWSYSGGNGNPYPQYETLTFRNCSFDTTRVGTNFNINGLDADNKIQTVTLDNCWFSNENAGSYVNNVGNLTISNHYVGKEKVTISSQAKLTTTEVSNFDYDWINNQAPVFTLPSYSVFTAKTEEELSFRVRVQDGDEEPVGLGVKEGTLPEGAVFDTETGAFSWTLSEEQVGRYKVVFTAADAYETTEKTIQIEVKSSKYKTLSVTAVSDATVKAWKTEKNNNYGTQDYIRTMRMSDAISESSTVGIFGETAGNDTSDTRDAKIAFLSFDASEIRENLAKLGKAELQLTYIGRRESSKTGEDKLMTALVEGDWSETELK